MDYKGERWSSSHSNSIIEKQEHEDEEEDGDDDENDDEKNVEDDDNDDDNNNNDNDNDSEGNLPFERGVGKHARRRKQPLGGGGGGGVKISQTREKTQWSSRNGRISKYKQCRHRNIFKNFGNIFRKFLAFHTHFTVKALAWLSNDPSQMYAF